MNTVTVVVLGVINHLSDCSGNLSKDRLTGGFTSNGPPLKILSLIFLQDFP